MLDYQLGRIHYISAVMILVQITRVVFVSVVLQPKSGLG
jgi:hypothetical protein